MWLILLALLTTDLCFAADDNTFVFRENLEYAPYIYRHKSANGQTPSAPQGYIPALLKYFVDDYGLQINYQEVPRKRLLNRFKKKQIDASILSPKWIDNPDDFVFSQPLALYRTVLFASDSAANNFFLKELKSQYICTRHGYRYPNLSELWKPNNLIRVDFSDEKLQIQGLLAGRCQYAVMDEAIGKWYIKRFFKDQNIKVVAEESEIPLTIGFRKDSQDYAQKFDRTISRLKANGELGILQRVFGVVEFNSPQ